MTDLVHAKDLLKLYEVSRATLTRWMNPEWASQRGITPFPSGSMKDGRTKVWNRTEVEGWVRQHRHQLGRHPARDSAGMPMDHTPVVTLTLGQAFDAALRVTEDEQQAFDADAFVNTLIEPIEKAFAQVLKRTGVQKVTWLMDEFAFAFENGEEGDRQAVAFKLAFS